MTQLISVPEKSTYALQQRGCDTLQPCLRPMSVPPSVGQYSLPLIRCQQLISSHVSIMLF